MTERMEPATEAGREMIANWSADFLNGWDLHTITDAILAIEAQATDARLTARDDALDVERLERAIRNHEPPTDRSWQRADPRDAELIAAEYARLSESDR